jgi:hypothetical protein
MKYIKSYEARKHKYKVGDWVLIKIDDYTSLEGIILDLYHLVGRESYDDLCYTVDTFEKIPEELNYLQYGDENSTKCVVEEGEIERRLNKKETEQTKLKKMANKYNI